MIVNKHIRLQLPYIFIIIIKISSTLKSKRLPSPVETTTDNLMQLTLGTLTLLALTYSTIHDNAQSQHIIQCL